MLGTRGFSSATGSFVSSAHRPKAADTSGEAFRAGRSLFRTLSKPETAHEKPLAPRQGSHCSMQQEKLSPGVSKCNHPRCLTSPFLKHGQANFTFTSTKEKRRIHDPLNCKSCPFDSPNSTRICEKHCKHLRQQNKYKHCWNSVQKTFAAS